MKTFEKVYTIVSKIPKGYVMTYGQIAKLADVNPRVVGFALHANKDPKTIPCHRVVNNKGELTGYAFGGIKKKKEILTLEGVTFIDNLRVNLLQSIYTIKA